MLRQPSCQKLWERTESPHPAVRTHQRHPAVTGAVDRRTLLRSDDQRTRSSLTIGLMRCDFNRSVTSARHHVVRNVVRKFLGTCDDSRLVESRKPHCLRLIESGFWECPRRSNRFSIAEGRSFFSIYKGWREQLGPAPERDLYWTLCSLSGWWQRPRIFVRHLLQSLILTPTRSPFVEASRNDGLRSRSGHPFHVARKAHWSPYGRNSASTKTLVSVCARKLLQRQSD